MPNRLASIVHVGLEMLHNMETFEYYYRQKKKSFKKRLNKADQGWEAFVKTLLRPYMPLPDTTLLPLAKGLHHPVDILYHQTKDTCRPHTADLLIQVLISN